MTNLTKETKAEISHVTNDSIKSMLEHRSVRDFTDEPISEEMLEAILEAGRAVSTSNYMQSMSWFGRRRLVCSQISPRLLKPVGNLTHLNVTHYSQDYPMKLTEIA